MTENTLTIAYISLSGNTQSFVKRLGEYLKEHYQLESKTINIKELKHETFPVTSPFIAVLPTYLEGGNGVDSGDVEILTNPLGDFIAAHDNYKHCVGIIGSGNRNFNEKRFGFPMLGDFELRGTSADIERLAEIIVNTQKESETYPRGL